MIKHDQDVNELLIDMLQLYKENFSVNFKIKFFWISFFVVKISDLIEIESNGQKIFENNSQKIWKLTVKKY